MLAALRLLVWLLVGRLRLVVGAGSMAAAAAITTTTASRRRSISMGSQQLLVVVVATARLRVALSRAVRSGVVLVVGRTRGLPSGWVLTAWVWTQHQSAAAGSACCSCQVILLSQAA